MPRAEYRREYTELHKPLQILHKPYYFAAISAIIIQTGPLTTAPRKTTTIRITTITTSIITTVRNHIITAINTSIKQRVGITTMFTASITPAIITMKIEINHAEMITLESKGQEWPRLLFPLCAA